MKVDGHHDHLTEKSIFVVAPPALAVAVPVPVVVPALNVEMTTPSEVVAEVEGLTDPSVVEKVTVLLETGVPSS